MISNRFKKLFGFLACTTLVACGGAGTEDVVPPTVAGPPPSGVVYLTLDGTDDVYSNLDGMGLQSNGSTGVLSLSKSKGDFSHSTGEIAIDDGTYLLLDLDGADEFGVLTDGSATATTTDAGNFTGIYDYLMAYEAAYESGGHNYDTLGLIGVTTNETDIPESGGATYSGEAIGFVIIGAAGYDLNEGTGTIIANFGAGTVDVEMFDFMAITDQGSGLAAVAPIDAITISGMTISYSGFSGGTLSTTFEGGNVVVTGTGTTTESLGNFYGFDESIGAPDEAGAVVLSQGSTGVVFGGVAAD